MINLAFNYSISEELQTTIKVIKKKDKTTTEQLYKKIKQIIASDEFTIEHYKNLRHDLSDYKRVHVAGSFVLLFKFFKKEKFILFDKFKHHDDAYKY